MHAGVERADRPHCGHHGETELPALGPVGVVLHLGEDEAAVVEAAHVDLGADGHGDEEEDQQACVGDGRYCLQHCDVFGRDAGCQALEDDARGEHAVRLARGDVEVSVFREIHGCEDLLGVAVGDGDGARTQGHGVCQSDEERQRHPDLLWGVVERPVVQPARRGDRGRQLRHRHADRQNQHRRDGPRPQEPGRACREPCCGDGGHRGEDAHDGVRDPEDLERGEPSLQLLLVSDFCKQRLVVGCCSWVELGDVRLVGVDVVHSRLQRREHRRGGV